MKKLVKFFLFGVPGGAREGKGGGLVECTALRFLVKYFLS